MSDLDEKGLEAAVKAHAACPGDNLACMKVAIRAYEAHKASQAGVADLSMNPDLYDEGGNLKASAACDGDPNEHCPTCGLNSMTIKATLARLEAHKASAVPEEIAEVVKNLRWVADKMDDELWDEEYSGDARRAADLLERLC